MATGYTLAAYQVSQLPPARETSDNLGKGVSSEQPLAKPLILTKPPAAHPVRLVHTNLRADRSGHVRVALQCTTTTPCSGVVDLRVHLILPAAGPHRSKRTVSIQLARAHFGPTEDNFIVTLRLGRGAMARLRRHHGRMAVQLTISSPGYPAERVSAVLS